MTLHRVHAGSRKRQKEKEKEKEKEDEIRTQLTVFETEGTKKYLDAKRREEKTEKMNKLSESTLYNKIHKTEKRAERSLHR